MCEREGCEREMENEKGRHRVREKLVESVCIRVCLWKRSDAMLKKREREIVRVRDAKSERSCD